MVALPGFQDGNLPFRIEGITIFLASSASFCRTADSITQRPGIAVVLLTRRFCNCCGVHVHISSLNFQWVIAVEKVTCLQASDESLDMAANLGRAQPSKRIRVEPILPQKRPNFWKSPNRARTDNKIENSPHSLFSANQVSLPCAYVLVLLAFDGDARFSLADGKGGEHPEDRGILEGSHWDFGSLSECR